LKYDGLQKKNPLDMGILKQFLLCCLGTLVCLLPNALKLLSFPMLGY